MFTFLQLVRILTAQLWVIVSLLGEQKTNMLECPGGRRRQARTIRFAIDRKSGFCQERSTRFDSGLRFARGFVRSSQEKWPVSLYHVGCFVKDTGVFALAFLMKWFSS
jgi:hypothetical protein